MEKGEEEEVDIKTTMQSSVAMQQSHTRRPTQLFLSSKQGGEEGGGGGGYQNYNAVFRSNAAELYLSAKAIVSFQYTKWRRGRRWRIRTTMQSSVAMQQCCTRRLRPLFPFSKQGVEAMQQSCTRCSRQL